MDNTCFDRLIDDGLDCIDFLFAVNHFDHHRQIGGDFSTKLISSFCWSQLFKKGKPINLRINIK